MERRNRPRRPPPRLEDRPVLSPDGKTVHYYRGSDSEDWEYLYSKPATDDHRLAFGMASAFRPPPASRFAPKDPVEDIRQTLSGILLTHAPDPVAAAPEVADFLGADFADRARAALQSGNRSPGPLRSEADRRQLEEQQRLAELAAQRARPGRAGVPGRLAREVAGCVKPELRPAVRHLWQWYERKGLALMLCGPSGCGKSFAGARWLQRWAPDGALWVDAGELAEVATWDEGGRSRGRLAEWKRAPGLVIDDVPARMNPRAVEALAMLLRNAFDQGRRVILTTLHPAPRIFAMFDNEGGNPIHRRWLQLGTVQTLPEWRPPAPGLAQGDDVTT